MNTPANVAITLRKYTTVTGWHATSLGITPHQPVCTMKQTSGFPSFQGFAVSRRPASYRSASPSIEALSNTGPAIPDVKNNVSVSSCDACLTLEVEACHRLG